MIHPVPGSGLYLGVIHPVPGSGLYLGGVGVIHPVPGSGLYLGGVGVIHPVPGSGLYLGGVGVIHPVPRGCETVPRPQGDVVIRGCGSDVSLRGLSIPFWIWNEYITHWLRGLPTDTD